MSKSTNLGGCAKVTADSYDECDGAVAYNKISNLKMLKEANSVNCSVDEGIYSLQEEEREITRTSSLSLNMQQSQKHEVSCKSIDEGIGSIGPNAFDFGDAEVRAIKITLTHSEDRLVDELDARFHKLEVMHVHEHSPETISRSPQDSAEIHELLYRVDNDGDTQLHLAIIHKDLERSAQFLQYANCQRDINIQNNLHQSPLHLAVLTHQPQLVQLLIQWGAMLDARDRFGNTALHLACKYGFTDCVWLLMSASTGRQFHECSQPPYTITQRSDVVDIGCTNYEGETCLHLAAANRHISVLQMLVSSFNININVREAKIGRTILHQAVELDQVEMVKFLVDNHLGVDIEARTYAGWTALEMAAGRVPTNKRTEIVRVLMSAGATLRSHQSDEECDSADDMDTEDFDDFEIGGRRIL